jgi:uncharacterized protein (DUF1810 family)
MINQINDDPYNLNRFISAQETTYENVLAELNNGRKRTHWMWFIFPQIDGLGRSATSKHYAIRSEKEALQYLNHPILGARLLKCAETVLAIENRSVAEIFGFPDNLKLKSSMTLFAHISQPGSVFAYVLNKYFGGKQDNKTLELLQNL